MTECTGGQCLSNAGVDTPTLQYGQIDHARPLHLCVLDGRREVHARNGDGFLISTSGITPLGNAKVTSS